MSESETREIEPAGASSPVTPRRPGRLRHGLLVVAAAVVLGAAALGAALLAWPDPALRPSSDALAEVSLPAFAGRVEGAGVTLPDGGRVPVRLTNGQLWPETRLPAGKRVAVELTVRTPVWASWLAGETRSTQFALETPKVQLREQWLKVKPGSQVTLGFTGPVAALEVAGKRVRLPRPATTVSIGVTAEGARSAGETTVAVAARSWERLSPPVLVAWFAERPYPEVLAAPTSKVRLAPDGRLTLVFSEPVAAVLGSSRPRITPASEGSWSEPDTHTLVFQPSGLGFGFATTVRVELPAGVRVAGQGGHVLEWRVPPGSTLRLQQLLAQLGYLPLTWKPASEIDTGSTAAQLAAAVSPPAGAFSWAYPNTPAELRTLWHPGKVDQITLGAIMTFENEHKMPADEHAGPKVWAALIADAMSGQRHTGGYSYVYVHSQVPQSLTLWHDGKVVLSSPGNTGVPAAPTQLGTFRVFEHIPVGTMSGTNPDGSHYNDPGIRWISYFNHGEAIHSFDRASFGTPQSLGCVELPLAAAAKVWPYTPVGTLVTIEK